MAAEGYRPLGIARVEVEGPAQPGPRVGREQGLFFFSSRRRHTRLSCDWSSDVCSSDLMIRHTRLWCDWSSDVCSSDRSEEHTSELQSHDNLVCRLLLRSEERRVGKECR